tara:strand:+ start:471 stop:1046 length:576 start_codon:yes stop_codon:yes gene_type:complete
MITFAREIHDVCNKQIADELYPICRDILDKTESDERYLFGKTTFWQQNIMKDNIHHFKNFFKFVDTETRKFINNLDLDLEDKQIHITDFWLSEMYKGGSHSTHIHSPENQISGNFYISAEPNSSNIVFSKDMHGDLFQSIKKKKYTIVNSQDWSFAPEPGRLLIWESDLMHRVEQNNSDSRISITFNLKIV